MLFQKFNTKVVLYGEVGHVKSPKKVYIKERIVLNDKIYHPSRRNGHQRPT